MSSRSVTARFGLLLLVLVLPCLSAAETEIKDDKKTLQKSWTLLHSFGAGAGASDFTKRGTIRLSIDEAAAAAGTANDPAAAVTMEIENQVEFTPADVQAMLEHGWYQLKIVPDDNKDSSSSSVPAVRTSVPACQLRRANFRDEIILTLGKDANVISLTYMPKISPLAPSTCDEYQVYSDNEDGIKVPKLNSDVSWETDVPGMVLKTVLPQYKPPPGLKYIKSSSNGKSGSGAGTIPAGATMTTSDKPPPSFTGKGGEDGDSEEPELDNSMFGLLKRYWYVVLPLVLSNLLTSSGGEEPKAAEVEGGGKAGESSGGAAGGTAPVGGSTASPQVRQRRGKRG